MKKFTSYIVIIFALFSYGCSNLDNAIGYRSGTHISQEQLDKLVVGRTTESALIKVLGSPQQQQKLGEETHYVYEYIEVNHVTANKNESTRFVFNDGILVDIQAGAGSNKNPLLGG